MLSHPNDVRRQVGEPSRRTARLDVLVHEFEAPTCQKLLGTHLRHRRPRVKAAARLGIGHRVLPENLRAETLVRLDQKLNVPVDRVAEPRRTAKLAEHVLDRVSERHRVHVPARLGRVDHRLAHLLDNVRILTDAWIGEDVLDDDRLDRLGPETRRGLVDRIRAATATPPALGRLERNRHETHRKDDAGVVRHAFRLKIHDMSLH
jgi:hypothetical protein